ncbi:MAG: hypothetical protein AAGL69_11785 [Pseudomonadota bacterium]
MKLRLLGNTIRLRLTRSEVARVAAGETVIETTRISANNKFEYALGPGAVDGVQVRLDEHRLTVLAPAEDLKQWGAGDRVALAEPQATEPRILVEKDFACLTPREGEDDVDTFEHPRAGTDQC